MFGRNKKTKIVDTFSRLRVLESTDKGALVEVMINGQVLDVITRKFLTGEHYELFVVHTGMPLENDKIKQSILKLLSLDVKNWELWKS